MIFYIFQHIFHTPGSRFRFNSGNITKKYDSLVEEMKRRTDWVSTHKDWNCHSQWAEWQRACAWCAFFESLTPCNPTFDQSRPLLIKGNHRCCSRFYSGTIYRVAMITSTIHDDLSLAPSRGYAWRIIPVSKWVVTLIYKPFGTEITRSLGDLPTMVINHLLIGMILQEMERQRYGAFKKSKGSFGNCT